MVADKIYDIGILLLMCSVIVMALDSGEIVICVLAVVCMVAHMWEYAGSKALVKRLRNSPEFQKIIDKGKWHDVHKN